MKTKIIKKILTAALAATLTFTTLAIPASAAWNTTDSGKQWVETDGTVAKSKWLTMKSGDRYYIKSNGNAATGLLTLTETVNGKKTKSIYYFDKDGKMQTGWQYVNKNYYYFNTKTGKAYTGTKAIGDYKFKFDSKGVWNGKVYNSKGKDVTANTDIEKITGIKTKTTTTTSKNPETVVIAGQEYKTDIKEILINKEGVTDEDLVNLKYLTNLRTLQIVPKATHIGASSIIYDYTDVKLVGKHNGTWKKDKIFYDYEYTESVRDTYNPYTNLDFCAYMPKLESVTIAYANKLTDISGLSKLKKLRDIALYNCTALQNLNALKTENFVNGYTFVFVDFTTDVKYAFNDYHFGKRIKTTSATFMLEYPITRYKCTTPEEVPISVTTDYSKYLFATEYAEEPPVATKKILYYSGKLSKNTFDC